jgi:hypothetical protein
LATCYRLMENRGFLAKPLGVAEHIAVGRDIHDPFIYMDTFFRHFDPKLLFLNTLK